MLRIIAAFVFLLLASVTSTAFAAEETLVISAQPIALGSVPRGATRIPLLSLTLRLPCGGTESATISGLILQHAGRGDPRDLERVYAWGENRRLSRAATPERTGGIRLRLPSLRVEPCTERTIHILADLSATAATAGEHGLLVKTVESAGSVTIQQGAAATTSTAGGEAMGSVGVEYLTVHGPVTYGTGRIVSRLRLTSSGDGDQQIRSMTLTNDGSARDRDLQNLSIVNAKGETISKTVTQMTGETVTFTFDPPLLMQGNQQMVIQVKADIRASRRRTIRFVVEEETDIEAFTCRGRGC